MSTIATPALLQSHRDDNVPAGTIAKQWQRLFDIGKLQAPPVAASVAISFGYLAWSVRAGAPLFKQTPFSRTALFSTAAIMTVAIVPFTIIFMSSTNNALSKKASATTESSGEETIELVKTWTTLNRLRSFLPLAGAFCGIAASLI